MTSPLKRPLGARSTGDGHVEFRVWAPRRRSVSLRLGQIEIALKEVADGVHEVVVPARAGDDYWFVLDGRRLPDPCSRWQPAGIFGPSRVLDLAEGDHLAEPDFRQHSLEQLVIYELHVGTFTAEGTFEAAIAHLRELSQLGVTAIEIMPVAEFPGRRGWGYDGVYISAAQSSYGGPSGLARLVQAAHDEGLSVILDVVYNHVGASGSGALAAFGPYFADGRDTPWGRAINFESEAVREWVLQSAVGWVRDFGIDGLRLDAIHAIVDRSREHIVAAITRRVREASEHAVVIAESAVHDPRVLRPHERGGYGCDAAWSEDFHNALRALLTDEGDGYHSDFGRVAQLADAFRGSRAERSLRRRSRGAPADVPRTRYVVYSQNHDKVGNRPYGDRMPAAVRPLAAFCTLLAPFMPLLLMGEEYGETAPFQYFSDHADEEIARATRTGRRREFVAPASFDQEVPDPQALETFERSKLTRRCDQSLVRLYDALLAARRRLPAGDVDGLDFDEEAGWLRVRRGEFELLCNFASESRRVPCDGAAVELATHGAPLPAGGYVELAPLSGALVRGQPAEPRQSDRQRSVNRP